MSMGEIEKLEEAYYAAANALNAYKESHGFVPGTRVCAQFQNEAPKFGVIPDYGSAWSHSRPDTVPVRLDEGFIQIWTVSNLRIDKVAQVI